MLQEELFLRQMEQFDQTSAIISKATKRIKAKKKANKPKFDKNHCLRPTLIQEGDWMYSVKGSLKQDHLSSKKFI